MLLQIVPYFLANYHLANCICVLYLANCVILQIVILLFSLQRWALKYVLIARGADVDLKNFPSVRAHLNHLSSKDISKILLS